MRPYRWRLLRPLFLLAWQLRERDVHDLGEPPPGDTRGAPEYKRGKVTGRTPDLVVITQTTESPYVCCGYCSAGMASWTAKSGLTHSMAGAAHPIRSAGGRPHDNGSRASELRDGAKGAHGVKLEALAVAEIPGVLRDGFAVVVNLDYAQLPSWLRVQSGSFGHSCTLYGWQEDGDLVGFFDPLWPEGARGAWATWAEVKPALWGDGEHSGTTTRWGEDPGPPPGPDPDPPPPGQPAEQHTDAELRELVAQGEAAGYRQALQDRDAAWRGTTLLEQPRPPSAWDAGGAPVDRTRWSWFGRWGPDVEPGTWNGPYAAWDELAWR